MPRQLPVLLLALGLFALALCARLPHLDRESLWEDDWLALARASMPPAEMARIQQWLGPSRTTYDFHPPLYYALEHTILGFDHSVYAVKFSGALAGALTVVVLFFLGRALFSTAAGLGCGVLAAGCLYHVAASRSIKVYVLLLLVFSASQLALWQALNRGRGRDWLLYALLGAALLYTAYVGAPAPGPRPLTAAAWPGRLVPSPWPGWPICPGCRDSFSSRRPSTTRPCAPWPGSTGRFLPACWAI